MKFLLVPILMFLVATQAFSKWVLLLEFTWNRDYISKNLCENRVRPMMKCGGKCQLMKRMAQEEKGNTPSQIPSGKSNFEEALFTATLPSTVLPFINQKNSSPHAYRKHWICFLPPCSVFRPPLV